MKKIYITNKLSSDYTTKKQHLKEYAVNKST